MDSYLHKLSQRKAEGSERNLKIYENGIDFLSNDYLGFARNPIIPEKALEILQKYSGLSHGSTGSRLISGNSDLYEQAEKSLAEFFNGNSALIFNSGYDANLGFISSVPGRNDTILYDELVHASIRDGIRLSLAKSYSFQHNDTVDLSKKIKLGKGRVFIVTESIFSMDGDASPLKEIAEIAKKNDCLFIVDEAHATGVFGKSGQGLVHELGLEKEVFARVITFGKALGVHGAAVLGSENLRKFLVNFARSFIYTTALPPHSIACILASLELLKNSDVERKQLKSLIDYFKQESSDLPFFKSDSSIQCLMVPGIEKSKKLAKMLNEKGFLVKAILSPTVPEGKERLRICVHSFNTETEIKSILQNISEYGI